MIKHSLYVGLSDPVTYEQKFSTEQYTGLLKEIFKNYHVPFSFQVISGGFIYDDDTFVEEASLLISIFEQSDEIIDEIAQDLCTFFNQKTVLVSKSEEEIHYVKCISDVYDTVNN